MLHTNLGTQKKKVKGKYDACLWTACKFINMHSQQNYSYRGHKDNKKGRIGTIKELEQHIFQEKMQIKSNIIEE